jgi:hypothetical protein
MLIRPAIALGVAALAASVITSPALAGANTSSQYAHRTAIQSSVSGLAVAAGTVTDPSGTGTPGAAVDLYAWPSDAVLNAMKPGQLVPTKMLATTTTNAAGKYTLMVPAARLEAAAVDSGYANLELYSPAGGFWFFPYQTGSLPARASAPVTVNLASKAKVSCGDDPHGHPYGFTGFSLVRHLHPAKAVVGQGYIVPEKKTQGDWVTLHYNQSSSHTQTSTLGVGLSGYGISAGFSTSGTNRSTANRGEGFPKSHENAWFLTEFRTAQYRGLCYEITTDLKVPRVKQHPKNACPQKWVAPGESNQPSNWHYVHKCYWLVASTGWFGGATVAHPSKSPRAPAGNCAPQAAGSSFHYDYGTAVDWSSGFTLGAASGIKGVNLKASFDTNAQTGYDANALMYFQFHKRGLICGTNTGPYAAAILVARGHG